jgi:dynein heavy chain
MYQFSLSYFKKLFLIAIESSQPAKEIEQRIENICDSITKLMFTDICRGLFESHKKIYSFLICTAIRRESKAISFLEWNYLIRGTTKTSLTANPDPAFISAAGWDFISNLEENFAELKGIMSNIKNKLPQWK